MSEVKSVSGILDVIKSITANGESGRLEIGSPETHGAGMHGVLLFVEGKLVDARLESLSGFQAVNAAVSLRDVEFSFDHVVPAPHAVSITPSERVVLKRFFGIEAAVAEAPVALAETETGWNEAPEQVVPLTEVGELPQTELEETPTVEVEAVHSVAPLHTVAPVYSVPVSNARRFSFLMRPQVVAICLVLLLGVIAGAITLRSRIKARQQATAVASVVTSESSAVSDGAGEVKAVPTESPAVAPVAKKSAKSVEPVSRSVEPVSSATASVKPAPKESPTVKPIASESPAVAVSQEPEAVHDLNGVWRVINTIDKTDYKSFHKMQLGFRLNINQKGNQFTAKGEKFSENGQTLPANSRIPIHVTGSIEGDKVIATFVEDGRRRRSNGRFVWKLQSSGDRLTGTFVSTAANNSGRSAVTKEF